MTAPVSVKLNMANDGSALTLAICNIDGPPLASATFNVQQLRILVLNLVQALAHLEAGIPLPNATASDQVRVPVPIPLPAWKLGGLDTGEPVIAVELRPNLWASFSLSILDGKRLAKRLQEKLEPNHQPKRPKRAPPRDR